MPADVHVGCRGTVEGKGLSQFCLRPSGFPLQSNSNFVDHGFANRKRVFSTYPFNNSRWQPSKLQRRNPNSGINNNDQAVFFLLLKCSLRISSTMASTSFYDSRIYPKWQLECADPMEAVLEAADQHKIKFFIGGGFYGDWTSPTTISDPVAQKQRLQSLEEVVRLYGHHPSFHGWYWPDEAALKPRFSPEFITYVNTLSRRARQLKPNAPIMIAPYGTRMVIPDDAYVRQLDAMDVDIVAYQDEVGVRKSKVTETSAFYEGLRKAHDRAQKAKLWADVEIFQFEGAVYKSALMPAPFERVLRQLEAVSPWVDEILVYQYQGMMNKPGSTAFAGCPASTRLYTDYQNWRKSRG